MYKFNVNEKGPRRDEVLLHVYLFFVMVFGS